MLCFVFGQADDAGLADTKDKEKAERPPVGPQHVLRWFGEVATHVKTQVDKVGLVNSLAPCGLVSDPSCTSPYTLFKRVVVVFCWRKCAETARCCQTHVLACGLHYSLDQLEVRLEAFSLCNFFFLFIAGNDLARDVT